MRVAACVVGHVRTMLISPVMTLLHTIPNLTSNGVIFNDAQAFNAHPHMTCDTPQLPPHFEVYERSNCKTYLNATGHTICNSDIAWLQHAWIQHCFRRFDSQHEVYLRLRPDLFVLPTLSPFHLVANQISSFMLTGIKWDAPQSDMLFALNTLGLATYLKSPLPTGCCSDYHRWHGLRVVQGMSVCLIRNVQTIQCWMPDVTNIARSYAMHVQKLPCHSRISCNSKNPTSCRHCIHIKNTQPCRL